MVKYPEILTADNLIGLAYGGGSVTIANNISFKIGDILFNSSDFNRVISGTAGELVHIRFTATGAAILPADPIWSLNGNVKPTVPGFYKVNFGTDTTAEKDAKWDSNQTDMLLGAQSATNVTTSFKNAQILSFKGCQEMTIVISDSTGNAAGYADWTLNWARTPVWCGYIHPGGEGIGLWSDSYGETILEYGDRWNYKTQFAVGYRPGDNVAWLPLQEFTRWKGHLGIMTSQSGAFQVTYTSGVADYARNKRYYTEFNA